MSEETERVEKLLIDLQASADTVLFIKEEIAVSIRRLCEAKFVEGLEMAANRLEMGNMFEWAGVIRSLAAKEKT